MLYDLRIVNARGHQEWNGHDRYDEAHSTLPFGVIHALTTISLASTVIRFVVEKNRGVADWAQRPWRRRNGLEGGFGQGSVRNEMAAADQPPSG
jgi:hypothetical protein